jgi:hypothetical protein
MDDNQKSSNTATTTTYVEFRALEQSREEEELDFAIPVNVNYAYDEFDPVEYQSACA